MRSLERGGLGGKRVIRLLLVLLIIVIDEDLEGWVIYSRGRRRRVMRMGMENLGKMGMFLGERRRGEGWCGVEIGRDAAAFCSDLYFRFFLMHYISVNQNQTPLISQQKPKIEKKWKNNFESLLNFLFLDSFCVWCVCVCVRFPRNSATLSLSLFSLSIYPCCFLKIGGLCVYTVCVIIYIWK